jgi:PTH1 family peptidyl-tRNA hydrolase
VVDAVAANSNETIGKKKFESLFVIARISGQEVCIVKPQTFMNLSGYAVREFLSYFKIDASDMLVVQDDIDMPLGRFKFVTKSGTGGHNGIESIANELGTNDFCRLKIGVSRPPDGKDPSEYVLGKFTPAEQELIQKVKDTAAEAVQTFIIEGAEAAMQKYNGSLVSI